MCLVENSGNRADSKVKCHQRAMELFVGIKSRFDRADKSLYYIEYPGWELNP